MRTIEIPGGTALFREANELRVKDERLMESASIGAVAAISKLGEDGNRLRGMTLRELAALGLNEEDMDAVRWVTDAAILAHLADWSRDEPLPTRQTLDELDKETYVALSNAVEKKDKAKVDFDAHPDRPGFGESPTEPSPDSEPDTRADQEPESIELPQNNGPSTGSDLLSPA
jgi:hypothetical protein